MALHIVQLLPELDEGGVERGVVELNREFVRRGFASTVISAGGRLVPQITAGGGRHETLDVCSKNVLSFARRARLLRETLARIAPDIVHVRSRLPAWLLRFANRPLGIPVVSTVHGFNSVSPYSRIMTRAERVICVSHAIREYVQRHYHVPDDRLVVIPRGVDPDVFNPACLDREFLERFRREQSLDNRFVVTSVGRITPLKDYETFARAIALARDELPGIVGLIVGGTRGDKRGYEARVRTLIAGLRAADSVRLVGSQRHMPEIYHLSDVVVSCSRKPEAFGRSLAEALAMETPVIATRHGGALEVVREGRNGFLFATGNAPELARLLVQVAHQPWVGLRADALARFSLDAMVETTLQVYRTVLGGRRADSPFDPSASTV